MYSFQVPEARMLKYTSMNLEKKRELNKAHEANARAAKKANLKRKLEGSPTPTVSGVPSADGSSPASKEAVKGNRWVLFPFPVFLNIWEIALSKLSPAMI
jgi:hypothetical protein